MTVSGRRRRSKVHSSLIFVLSVSYSVIIIIIIIIIITTTMFMVLSS